MSIHPSLKISEQDKKQRSVLKRSERIRSMMEKDRWKEGDKVFGLPKIKTIRIKIAKKEKAAAKPEEGKEGAVPAAGVAPAAKTAKTAKEAKK